MLDCLAPEETQEIHGLSFQYCRLIVSTLRGRIFPLSFCLSLAEDYGPTDTPFYASAEPIQFKTIHLPYRPITDAETILSLKSPSLLNLLSSDEVGI